MTSLLGTAAFLIPSNNTCANLDTYAWGVIDLLDLLVLVKLYVSTNRLPHYRRGSYESRMGTRLGEPNRSKYIARRVIVRGVESSLALIKARDGD